MLANILRNAEWSQLNAFVSPALFAVLPPRKLYERARSIRCSAEAPSFRSALAERQQALRALPLSIVLTAEQQGKEPESVARDGLGVESRGQAERIVTLYFHQLFSDAPTLIDLRASAFEQRGSLLAWRPAAWLVRWDPAFHSGLTRVYSGFYRDDADTFQAGLDALGIASCADLFRSHFGGDQSQHAFHTREFVSTFHQVFVRCREQQLQLHPDFLALGIYLAGLYDALDPTGIEVDVRACFERAYQHSTQARTPEGASRSAPSAARARPAGASSATRAKSAGAASGARAKS